MSERVFQTTVQMRQVKNGWRAYIEIPQATGKLQTIALQKGWLSTTLAKRLNDSPLELDGQAVECMMIGSLIHRIWEVGSTWDRTDKPDPPTPVNEPRADRHLSQTEQTMALFENPYNFIPAPPRNTHHPELGDAEPVGHHRWHANRWSGRISVELTTATPMLIPDIGQTQNNGHKTYGLRVDEDGVPDLPPTTIKGSLRVAYEAITNSRMGVLNAHDKRLALRMGARDGIKLVPCRIIVNNFGLLEAQLLPGQSKIGPQGKPKGQGPDCLMYAAWLSRYQAYSKTTQNIRPDKHESSAALNYAGTNQIPRHGDHVFVQVIHQVHKSKRFAYLRVTSIQRAFENQSCPQGWKEGWVFVSGRNVMNKHDERVFLQSSSAINLLLDHITIEGWARLIENYQEIHRTEINARRQRDPSARPEDYLGHDPGETGFSRHVYLSGVDQLTHGTLCFAEIETDIQGVPLRVTQLLPVSISRLLYDRPPVSRLTGTELNPADILADLSPADRIFGWVNSNGHGSHKGQLRIGTVTCLDGANAIEHIGGDHGKPLAILGQPKPAQARFYAARNQQGEPLEQGKSKTEGYQPNSGLRGRKVYPHQQQAEAADYWDASTSRAAMTTTRFGGREIYREWQSHDDARDDQNRSVKAWVKSDTRFTFDIDVINLSAVELGALLWLLSLPDAHYLRIGGGKPLGFGSVRLAITEIALRDGEAIGADYKAFDGPGDSGKHITEMANAGDLINAYRAALSVAVGQPNTAFEDLYLIRAFCNAARGGQLPVHYPRTTEQGRPSGENYKWFVKNENSQNNQYPLPPLWDEDQSRGLPIL